jgi:hypothetical protein
MGSGVLIFRRVPVRYLSSLCPGFGADMGGLNNFFEIMDNLEKLRVIDLAWPGFESSSSLFHLA